MRASVDLAQDVVSHTGIAPNACKTVSSSGEWGLIRARISEGRKRAKARGVKLGRKPKMTEHQKREAVHPRDVGGETLANIAGTYNVSRSTISGIRV